MLRDLAIGAAGGLAAAFLLCACVFNVDVRVETAVDVREETAPPPRDAGVQFPPGSCVPTRPGEFFCTTPARTVIEI